VIQLNAAPFWLASALAVVILLMIRTPAPRRVALAILNLGFVALLLRGQVLWVLAGLAALYGLLRLVEDRRGRLIGVGLVVIALVPLFVLHKLPGAASLLGVDPLGRALALVGFSYVALRVVEVLRAVYEGRRPCPGVDSLTNYLLPFHMLAAGPIQAYDDFVDQPGVPDRLVAGEVLRSVERISSGLFKKFVLAFALQRVFLTDFQANGPYIIIEMQVFFVWLFLDFSAYSDIAVGIGTLIGVRTPENFNHPLAARNVIDFWDRWHMSLSKFIQRNLFIPIQVSLMRKTDGKMPLLLTSVAVGISFVLCGLWHGLTAGFLIWGVGQAAGLIVVRLYGHVLQQRLGKKGLKTYLANPVFRFLAVVVSFEFEAATLIALFRA
jgi:D-alanyl-lipoteichoic acid acyltransferase DltB (MBOAT superfamily)